MKIKKLSIILFYILFWANISVAEIFIYAIVRDINTHRKIRNVNIFIKGTKVGTTSDAAGRFSLKVAQSTPGQIVVFRHIGYEIYEVPLDSLATMRYVYLQPRVIPLQPVEVEGAGIQGPEIQKDLPQHVSIIEAKDFEIRGYVDAADLLRTDHSIQIDEQLSGKKTVSIRGGNPDEVAVMFNGIKMNSSYNNVFDFSLIDLEDVERFEIIKGSNTALYGSETFSGVINIVPKIEQDYTVRFQQRLGTYRSGNWGLHFYKRLNRLLGSYSFKRGGAERNFRNALPGRQKLTNTSLHHTANLSFSFSRDTRNLRRNLLSAMYLFTDLDYENQRDSEYLASFNHLLSLQYAGDLLKIRNLDLSVSLRRLDETQFLVSGSGLLERNIDERTLQIDTEKRFKLNRLDLLFAYQVKIAHLDFVDIRKNAVCRRHLDDVLDCHSCFSYVSPALDDGSKRYADGRVICSKCQATAVEDDNEALAIMEEVKAQLASAGLVIEQEFKLKFVSVQELSKLSSNYQRDQLGVTRFRKTEILAGLVSFQDFEIFILSGLPLPQLKAVLAHELMHVWQFANTPNPQNLQLCEGNCQYAAYLVLSDDDSEEGQFFSKFIEEHKDSNYGDGFRFVSAEVKKRGFKPWLEYLKVNQNPPW
ncbi:protein DA1 [candidate division KSB1 bacterium]|nr:protein DA1 [candidate division KSB1 bacterium]